MKTLTPQFIYGTAWKKNDTARCVEKALAAGFRAIDTANQLKHYDEALVGQALKAAFDKGLARETLFLQTKFTSRDGQDHRLPYDENTSLSEQVSQSFKSSLTHLPTDYLDSYVLHGPYNFPGLGEEDWEVWGAMEKLHDSGAVRKLGVSNVNALQLVELLEKSRVKPSFVQNRCFANRAWDRQVREICQRHAIHYQGFSLLTANPFVLSDSAVLDIARRLQATPEQVVFRFAMQVGMIPLTGTTDSEHMRLDLQAAKLELTSAEVDYIERMAL